MNDSVPPACTGIAAECVSLRSRPAETGHRTSRLPSQFPEPQAAPDPGPPPGRMVSGAAGRWSAGNSRLTTVDPPGGMLGTFTVPSSTPSGMNAPKACAFKVAVTGEVSDSDVGVVHSVVN